MVTHPPVCGSLSRLHTPLCAMTDLLAEFDAQTPLAMRVNQHRDEAADGLQPRMLFSGDINTGDDVGNLVIEPLESATHAVRSQNLVRARPPRSGHLVLNSVDSPGLTRTPESKRTRVMGQNAPEVATQGWMQPELLLDCYASPLTQATGNHVQSIEERLDNLVMQAVQSSSGSVDVHHDAWDSCASPLTQVAADHVQSAGDSLRMGRPLICCFPLCLLLFVPHGLKRIQTSCRNTLPNSGWLLLVAALAVLLAWHVRVQRMPLWPSPSGRRTAGRFMIQCPQVLCLPPCLPLRLHHWFRMRQTDSRCIFPVLE